MPVKKTKKEPNMPVERHDTLRQYIIALLEEYTLSARELSAFAKISETDVYDHLAHIRRTLNKNNRHLAIIPAQCETCGFVFRKRERFSKPGKCPQCRSSQILPPFFSIVTLLR